MRKLFFLLAVGGLLSACSDTRTTGASAASDPLDQARAEIVARNYGSAAELAREATKAEPANPAAYLELARAEVLRGNHSAGLSALRTAIEKGLPDAARALEDPAFDSIREDREFALLVERASPRSGHSATAARSNREPAPRDEPEVEISTRNGEDYIRAGDVVIDGDF